VPQVVWSTIEPVEHHVDWMADAVSITFTGPTTRGAGTAFDCLTRVGPFRTTDHMVITEWEPGRAMGIEHRGAVTGHGRFTLQPDGDHRTRFTWRERLRLPMWMGGRFGEVIAKPVLMNMWQRNLARLKALVEGT
jgi:polyketide cyclase/dehydrase/lipid transport protein